MAGSLRPPFPSAPSEPSLRRLGTGNGPNGERPIRAQLIVALVALIILLAVPLYLWRRPTSKAIGSDAGAPTTSAPLAATAAALPPPVISAPSRVEAVRTSPPQRVRCGSSRARATTSLPCDALPALERSLVEAIQKNADCAPRTTKEGTINFVLEVDFIHKSLHVFPGRSGDWHGPSARRATKCVERSLGKPDLAAMTHNFGYYALAVLATYPATGASSSAPNLPIPPTFAPGPAGSADSVAPPALPVATAAGQ